MREVVRTADRIVTESSIARWPPAFNHAGRHAWGIRSWFVADRVLHREASFGVGIAIGIGIGVFKWFPKHPTAAVSIPIPIPTPTPMGSENC